MDLQSTDEGIYVICRPINEQFLTAEERIHGKPGAHAKAYDEAVRREFTHLLITNVHIPGEPLLFLAGQQPQQQFLLCLRPLCHTLERFPPLRTRCLRIEVPKIQFFNDIILSCAIPGKRVY